jgi:hypothetical protein
MLVLHRVYYTEHMTHATITAYATSATVREIASKYRDNPFHNFEHCCHGEQYGIWWHILVSTAC